MILIIYALVNSLALLVSAYLLKPNVYFSGNSLMVVLIAGSILALANAILKPILKLLSFPLIFLTFGIFSFIISLGMLWITDQLMVELTIKGFPALLFTTIIVGLFNIVGSGLKKII